MFSLAASLAEKKEVPGPAIDPHVHARTLTPHFALRLDVPCRANGRRTGHTALHEFLSNESYPIRPPRREFCAISAWTEAPCSSGCSRRLERSGKQANQPTKKQPQTATTDQKDHAAPTTTNQP